MVGGWSGSSRDRGWRLSPWAHARQIVPETSDGNRATAGFDHVTGDVAVRQLPVHATSCYIHYRYNPSITSETFVRFARLAMQLEYILPKIHARLAPGSSC